jgi:hypothetical protein
MEFEQHKWDCPWYLEGDECGGKSYYNQHVNDRHFGGCAEWTCPIFYWVSKLEEVKT